MNKTKKETSIMLTLDNYHWLKSKKGTMSRRINSLLDIVRKNDISSYENEKQFKKRIDEQAKAERDYSQEKKEIPLDSALKFLRNKR